PYVIRRFGARASVVAGIPIFFLSVVLFALLPVHPNFWINLLPPMLLMGLGGTLSSQPLSFLAMSQVESADAGLASGLINTSRQTGGAFGVALAGSLAAAYTAALAGKMSPTAALNAGYHVGFWIDATSLVVAFAVAVLFLRNSATRQTAAEKASSIADEGEL
ncbi:MAG TPA: MFS transporter, partial [Candidatus Paceibacterota bacterium]|nr:MFS transporter [Candidatus Paceibacterota bacterium]